MSYLKMVNKIYENVNNYELHFHRLQHNRLKNFSTTLNRLETAIRNYELSNEPILNDIIVNLRRYRFYIVAALIPFNNFEAILEKDKLEKLYSRSSKLYPNLIDEIESCYLAFNSLSRSSENPLLNYIKENIDSRLQTGVLLKAVYDFESTKNEIRNFSIQNEFKLIGPQILKTNNFFEQLVVIGPTRWFPEFIYNSPHALKIHTITYNWLEGKFQEEPYLYGGITKSTIFSGREIIFHDHYLKTGEEDNIINDYNIEKAIDLSYIEQQVKEKYKNNESEEGELIPAKLVLLNGNKGIFFEDISLKNIFSIFSETEGFTVGKTSINEVEENTYILVRTGTKQDLIRKKADEIIGTGSKTFRIFHRRWKFRLKKFVNRYGIISVQKALEKQGAKNPAEQNIRNWMSEDNIMPASEIDFKAILKFVKLDEEESKHVKVAKLLRRAHMEAGVLIRNKLINEIKNTDLSGLELRGEHVFNLSDEDGVSFTAYRVEYISKQNYQISSSKLKEIFHLN
ncbi:hypothetical protein [Bacillus sp. ISL-39]|uniref:hypothetical protein n=1 Tax=Bacillus sp. ISL-39 TaxID=2819124 RepID=UPI001BE5FCF3|nr:hypothetical protein [Bacillus sp. ISL-39]MBT2636699.1 hypothetical protein [Bacillus sp. ISL-39]